MFCPVPKGEGVCANVLFVVLVRNTNLFFVYVPSGFGGLAHEPHVPTTRTISPHQRPAPMASVPTGGPIPPPAAAAPKAAPAAAAAAAYDICCCNTRHLQSTDANPADATPPCAIDLSSEMSKYNASDRLAGASHATAAVLTPGSTTTRTQVNIAANFGQEMSPVWANFAKF